MTSRLLGLERQDLPILRACVASDADFERYLRLWEKTLEIENITGDHLRFVPLLYRRAEQLGVTMRDHALAKGVYTKNWYHHHVDHGRLLDLLHSTGLDRRVLLLKGHGLHGLVYRSDPPTRPSADVDILVRRDERSSVVRQLLAAGLRLKKRGILWPQLLTQRSVGLHDARGELDVHWGLFDYSPDPGLEERLQSRARDVTVRGRPCRTLHPTDHLLHTLLHGAPKNVVSPVRWVVDAHLLIAGGEIDWLVFSEEVIANRWRHPIYQQLLLLREEFNCPIPEDTLDVISASRPSRLSAALTWRNSTGRKSMRRLTQLLYRDQILLAQSLGLRWRIGWLPLLAPAVAVILIAEKMGGLALRLTPPARSKTR